MNDRETLSFVLRLLLLWSVFSVIGGAIGCALVVWVL